ncbi:MAG: ROK family protein [Clostridia bacterium]|nr:ROK family protein [Clostridia bacterium]
MKYQNAKDYLSAELFDALQQQAGGRLLYVPMAGEKKSWGEVSGERVKLRKRNAIICREHAEGLTAAQLADKWFLSVASIRKILAAGRQLPPDHYLGIDIGGTYIKYGTANPDGSLIHNSKIQTPKTESSFIQALYHIIDTVCEQDPHIRGIGIGIPGLMKDHNFVTAANLPLNNTPLLDRLRTHTNLPVMLENDANCAALGVYTATNDNDDLLYITLGTGIGGGLIIGGQLYRGHRGFGGEIGHIIIEKDGLPCGCGQAGCFEQYASTSALIRQTRQAIVEHPDSLLADLAKTEGLDGKLPFLAKEQGCPIATDLIESFCCHLAIGIDSLVRTLDPSHIFLAGAITTQGERLLEPIARYRHTDVPVTISIHFEHAGIIGAARLFKGETP